MQKTIFLAMAAVLALAGCKDESAPEVSDSANIVINGQQYQPKAYLQAFCQHAKAASDSNCLKVEKQAVKDMSKFQKVEW